MVSRLASRAICRDILTSRHRCSSCTVGMTSISSQSGQRLLQSWLVNTSTVRVMTMKPFAFANTHPPILLARSFVLPRHAEQFRAHFKQCLAKDKRPTAWIVKPAGHHRCLDAWAACSDWIEEPCVFDWTGGACGRRIFISTDLKESAFMYPTTLSIGAGARVSSNLCL